MSQSRHNRQMLKPRTHAQTYGGGVGETVGSSRGNARLCARRGGGGAEGRGSSRTDRAHGLYLFWQSSISGIAGVIAGSKSQTRHANPHDDPSVRCVGRGGDFAFVCSTTKRKVMREAVRMRGVRGQRLRGPAKV